MVDREGAPLGRIVHIYLDRVTEEPERALVATGPGGRKVFVPLVDAAEQDDQIRVPVERTWSLMPQPSELVGSCPRRPPPGCTATTAAPRSCAGQAPGARQAADRPPVCGEC